MDETIINIIGYIGSFFISLNLIPQILTIIKKKSGKNISYFSLTINIIASILMLIYSIDKKLYPIIISNVVIFISSFFILFLKKYYKIIELNYLNLSKCQSQSQSQIQVINKIQQDEIIEFDNLNNCI